MDAESHHRAAKNGVTEGAKFLTRQRLREEVSDVLMGINVAHAYGARAYELSDPEVSHCNVPGAPVVHGVVQYVDSGQAA